MSLDKTFAVRIVHMMAKIEKHNISDIAKKKKICCICHGKIAEKMYCYMAKLGKYLSLKMAKCMHLRKKVAWPLS